MITDHDIERAIDWMRDNATVAAQASADVITMEEGLKTAIALAASQSQQTTMAAAERDARLTRGVQDAIAGKVAAVFQDRKMRLLYAAAEAKIEAWRTQQANARAEGKATS